MVGVPPPTFGPPAGAPPLTGFTGGAAAAAAGGIIAIGAPLVGAAAAGVVTPGAAAAGAGAAADATFCATWLPTFPAVPSAFVVALIAPVAIRADDSATPAPRLAKLAPRPAPAAPAPAPTPAPDPDPAPAPVSWEPVCAPAGLAAPLPRLLPDDPGDDEDDGDEEPAEAGFII